MIQFNIYALSQKLVLSFSTSKHALAFGQNPKANIYEKVAITEKNIMIPLDSHSKSELHWGLDVA